MKPYAILLPVLSGCSIASSIGAVPRDVYNSHIEQMESFSKDALTNQGQIGAVTIELATENVLEAKKDNDEAKLERSIGTRVRAELATKEADKLAQVKFERDEGQSFDFSGLLSGLMAVLSTMFPALGGYLLILRNQLGRVKEKAKTYATSPETFDISKDKDLK